MPKAPKRSSAASHVTRDPVRAVSRAQEIAETLWRSPQLVPSVLEGLSSREARTRFEASKALGILSEKAPEALYPSFDFLAGLLDHPNRILRWQAMRILGRLAAVDHERRIDSLLPVLLAFVRGPELISAGNAIQAGADIALARPGLSATIVSAIIGVADARLPTAECLQIAGGHAIQALDRMMPVIADPGPAVSFVRSMLHSTRPATRKKAERFIAKWLA